MANRSAGWTDAIMGPPGGDCQSDHLRWPVKSIISPSFWAETSLLAIIIVVMIIHHHFLAARETIQAWSTQGEPIGYG